MNFQNQNSAPFVYLPQVGGFALTASLTAPQAQELELQIHGPAQTPWPLGAGLLIALSPEIVDPERCIPANLLRHNPRMGSLQITVSNVPAFWAAARAAHAFNRRRSFRVSTIDSLPVPEGRNTPSLEIEIQHGFGRMRAEMLDFSVTGCGLRIPRNELVMPPELGTRVLMQVTGGDLTTPLRIPAEVLRGSDSRAYSQIGLQFIQGNNRSWKQVELQISKYLTHHQQRLMGKKAA